jgi:hypothetical protein
MELKKKYDVAFSKAQQAKAADKALGRTRAYKEACSLYLDAIDAFTAAQKLEFDRNNKQMVEGQIKEFSARARELAQQFQPAGSGGGGASSAGGGGGQRTGDAGGGSADFSASATFRGGRAGYVFKRGVRGVGYYKDGASGVPSSTSINLVGSSSSASTFAWPEVPTAAPVAPKTPPAAPAAGGPTSLELTNRINLQETLAKEKLGQAVASDRGGDRKAAYDRYMVAADCFMDLVKARLAAHEDTTATKKQIADILARAEWLKNNVNAGGEGGHLSKDEIDVLMRSSVINKRLFQPFLEGEETAEQVNIAAAYRCCFRS